MNLKLFFERIFTNILYLVPSEVGVLIRRFFYKPLFRKAGKKISIKGSVILKHLYNIEIGEHTNINHFCFINGMGGIKIGKDCEIAPMVSIVSFNYKKDNLPLLYKDQGEEKNPIEIGNNVWLGSKVTVAAGIKIGDNCIIGANSVVTKDIPPNSMAVGSPAKVIKIFKDGKWSPA